MAVSKVIYDGNTLIDLTGDTVTAETLAQGVTAHAASGESITGTLAPVADPTLQSKTVTPKAAAQTVTADSGYDGLSSVTVNGDSNLVAANILSGKTIFGVAGSVVSGAKVVCGSVTISDTTSYSIEHGLGQTPNFAIIYKSNTTAPSSGAFFILSLCRDDKKSAASGGLGRASASSGLLAVTQKITWDSSKVTFAGQTSTASGRLYSGYKYMIGVL